MTTYWVSTTGSDVAAGTEAAPFATLQKGIDVAVSGDTVVLMSGLYIVSAATVIDERTNTDEAPLTIVGQPKAILQTSGAGIPTSPYGLLAVTNSSFVVIRNITVEQSAFSGIEVSDSTDVVVEYCTSIVSLGPGIDVNRSERVYILYNDVSYFCNQNFDGPSGGWGCQEGISLNTVTDFIVRGNLVHDAPQQPDVTGGGGEGLDIKNGSGNGVVVGNYIWNLVQIGLYVDGGASGVADVSVVGNWVWNCYHGITVASEGGGTVSDVDIHDNVIYNVGYHGVYVSGFVSNGLRENLRIYNNTIVNSGVKEQKPPWVVSPTDAGIGINITTTNVTGLVIANNIVQGAKTYAMDLDPSKFASSTVDTNLIWPETVSGDAYDGTNIVSADALFVDDSRFDWRLQSTSPAIGAGLTTLPLSVDARNIPRDKTSVDLGALVTEVSPQRLGSRLAQRLR